MYLYKVASASVTVYEGCAGFIPIEENIGVALTN